MSSRALAPIVLLALVMTSCSRAGYKRYVDEFREDIVSPDRAKKAIIFRRTCERANPMYGSVHVCLSPSTASTAADADTVFTTDGDMTVSARWIDSAHLRIIYGRAPVEDGSTIDTQKKSYRSVAIDYSHIQ
jgi:hypothetical protein